MLSKKRLNFHHSILIVVAFCCFSISSAVSQNKKRDSLVIKIKEFQKSANFQKNTQYIDVLYDLGREISAYNLDSLLLLSNETIQLSQAIEYSEGEIKGLINLGSYYSETGKQNQAIENFLQANSIAQKIDDLELLMQSKNLLAIEYEYKEDYAKALNEYLDGMEIAKKSSHDRWLTTFYVNTANFYSVTKDNDLGIYFLKKAKELNKSLGDQTLTAQTLANLTASYIEIGDLKNASENIDQSIAIFEDLNLTFWLTYAYELKATIFLKHENYDTALLWFKKSEKIHEKIDQKRYKIALYNGISKAYFGLKVYDKVEFYAIKGLEMADEMNVLDQRVEILKTLYELKKHTKEPLNSLAYLELYKNTSDSINKHNNEKELRILKSRLEFDKEKELYLIENEKRVSRQKTMFYSALLIILSFLLIILFLRKSNKIQGKLNGKLVLKTSELENSNKTKTKLFSIIAHDLKGPINSFKSILDLYRDGDISNTDFLSIVPRMGYDIEGIAFTLNNLLHWGQSQMKGSVTNAVNTNLRPITAENISLLFKMAEKKSITLKNEIDFDVMTWSDKDQIGIVIRNLISNAIKFTQEKGKITIGAIEKSESWKVFVKDNGVGMNRETIDLIFNEKDSFSTYGTSNEKGTGLGLNLCQEMVQKNDGRIWAESEPNKGTCFYFTIPKESQA